MHRKKELQKNKQQRTRVRRHAASHLRPSSQLLTNERAGKISIDSSLYEPRRQPVHLGAAPLTDEHERECAIFRFVPSIFLYTRGTLAYTQSTQGVLVGLRDEREGENKVAHGRLNYSDLFFSHFISRPGGCEHFLN